MQIRRGNMVMMGVPKSRARSNYRLMLNLFKVLLYL
jgi:hypothetical protein